MLRLILLIVTMVSFAVAQGPLRFELKRLEKKTSTCVITFEFPEIISASSPQARDRMNAGILRVLLRNSSWPGSDSGFRSLDAYADAFIGYCAEFQRGPDPRELYEHKRMTIFRYTPPILSFRSDTDEDGGGVHPFGSTFFVNFESSTGKTIAINDLIREGGLAKLESIAEANFRRDNKLSPTQSLSEQGYGFPGDRFRLNDNFGIGEEELVFFFNSYEIAAGAMGPTEIKIAHPFLRGLLKPDFQLEQP